MTPGVMVFVAHIIPLALEDGSRPTCRSRVEAPVERNGALTLDGASHEYVVTCGDRDTGSSAGSGFYTA